MCTFQPYLRIPNYEDGNSGGSFSEAEERTIKAVCEQMKVSFMCLTDSMILMQQHQIHYHSGMFESKCYFY